jgi:VanZ family protein
VVLFLCWLPATVVQKIEGESPWFQVPNLDKAIHVGLFVVLAILWRRAYPSKRAIGAVILGGVLLGAITELGQLLPIVRRHAELHDLAMDSVGVLIGVAIAPLFEPLLRAIERMLIRVPSPAESAAIEQ